MDGKLCYNGHGYRFRKGDTDGYYTIMALPRKGYHFTNYYSSPDIIHPKTGTPTGKRNHANSARILRARRFAMAAVGDESQQCWLALDELSINILIIF